MFAAGEGTFEDRLGEQARALIEMGRYQQAIPVISKALAQKPDSEWLYGLMSDACFYLENFSESRKHAQQALHLNPNYDYAHFRLAWVCLRELDFDAALRHARAAVSIDADSGNLHVLAWAEYHGGNQGLALAAAEQALMLDPENASPHALLGSLNFNYGRLEQAERHYLAALRHAPEDAMIHSNLGYLMSRQGRIQAATAHFLNAVRIDPGNASSRDDLFDLLHHHLMDQSLVSRAAELEKLDPSVRAFYQDQLGRRGEFERMRTSSMVGLWIVGILVMMVFFSWLKGHDMGRLLGFLLVALLGYAGFFAYRVYRRKQQRL